jgi:hypothetical protein
MGTLVVAGVRPLVFNVGKSMLQLLAGAGRVPLRELALRTAVSVVVNELQAIDSID